MFVLALRQSYDVFFFNATATTEIYTLSLHDALPIFRVGVHDHRAAHDPARAGVERDHVGRHGDGDRKSTRLNSSHSSISYAVFCLKKKTTGNNTQHFVTVTDRSYHPSWLEAYLIQGI